MRKFFGFCLVFLLFVTAMGFSLPSGTSRYTVKSIYTDDSGQMAQLYRNAELSTIVSLINGKLTGRTTLTLYLRNGGTEEWVLINRRTHPAQWFNYSI